MKTNPDDSAQPKAMGSSGGLTKREYFAATALQGLIDGGYRLAADNATEAVEYADALIEALNETK
jgi:hypothetical protein